MGVKCRVTFTMPLTVVSYLLPSEFYAVNYLLPSEFVRDSAFPFEIGEDLIAKIDNGRIVIERPR